MSPWLTRNYEKFLMRIPLNLNLEPAFKAVSSEVKLPVFKLTLS